MNRRLDMVLCLCKGVGFQLIGILYEAKNYYKTSLVGRVVSPPGWFEQQSYWDVI